MLAEQAKRFSFFQLVQLLERYHQPRARIGHSGPPEQEVIRFRPDESLGFPISDVAGIEEMNGNPARYRVATTFLGLYGSVSPLPMFYAEEILWNDPDENPVRDFLDVFHHRLLSFFYRAWLKYRHHLQFDPSGEDPFSRRLFALMGLGTPEILSRTGLPFVRLLRYVGLFHQRPHSASALEDLVSDFFGGVATRIEQCAGRWVVLKPEQQASLGRASCRLGWDASIGAKVYSASAGFRIHLGPLHYPEFASFLPSEENYRQLSFLVRLFVTDRLDFDIELRVLEHEIPFLQLTSKIPSSRLGWTSWLISKRRCHAGEEGHRSRSLRLAGRLPDQGAV